MAARRTSRATEVLERLAAGAAATEQHCVGASGVTHGKLVEGQALAAGLLDACARRVGEAERADRHLGDVEEAGVVDDSAHDNGGLVHLVLHVGKDARHRHHRAVVLALEEALEDLLVERGLGAAAQEAVELDEESEVGILALGETLLVLSLAVAVELVNGLYYHYIKNK